MPEPIRPSGPTFHCCDCHEHALSVDVWRWQSMGSVDIDFWHKGNQVPTWRTWRQRIRDAWRVLRYGTLYLDTVSLEPQAAKRFAKAVLEAALEVDDA